MNSVRVVLPINKLLTLMVILTITVYKMVRYLLNLILFITLWIAFIQIHHTDSASLNDPDVKKDYKEIKLAVRKLRIQERGRLIQQEYEQRKMKETENDTKDAQEKNKVGSKVKISTTKTPKVVAAKVKARSHNEKDKYKREWNVREKDGL